MQPLSITATLPDLVRASRMPLRGGDIATDGGWGLDALVGRMTEISSGDTSASLTATASILIETQLRGEPAAWIRIGDSCFYPPDLAESGADLSALPVVRVPDMVSAARAADRLMRSGGFGLVILDLASMAHSKSRASKLSMSYRATYSKNAEFYADRMARRDPHPPGSNWERRGSEEPSRTSLGRHLAPSHIHRTSGDGASFGSRLDSRNPTSPGGGSSSKGGMHRGASASPAFIPMPMQTRLAGLAKKHGTALLCLTRKEKKEPSLGSLISLRAVGEFRKTAFDRFLWRLEVLKDKHRGPGWSHSEACRGPTGLY